MAGKYEANEAGCVNAPQGKYIAEGLLENSLALCAAGKHVASGDGALITDCVSCSAGKSVDEGIGGSQGDCDICSAGKYTNGIDITICSDCGGGTYSSNDRSQCLDCPAGKFVAAAAGLSVANCQNCAAGTFSVQGSGTCTACPPGTFSNAAAANTCTDCPLGTFAADQGTPTECSLCDFSFYQDQLGQDACIVCPAGRITPTIGATDLGLCVSPEANFYTGFAVIGVVVLVFLEYLVHGRYHRIAFLRRQRVTARLVDSARRITTQLHYYGQRAEAEKLRDYTNRTTKTWMFIFSSIVMALLLTGGIFVVVLGSIFFKSMILWKGLKLDFPFISQMAEAVKELASLFKIPGFEYLFV